jgi:hypothetical protein
MKDSVDIGTNGRIDTGGKLCWGVVQCCHRLTHQVCNKLCAEMSSVAEQMGELEDIRAKLVDTRAIIGAMRASAEDLEQHAVRVFLDNNISWYDESGSGAGPFWVLAKSTATPMLNRAQQLDFFATLLDANATSPITPVDCVHAFDTYKKKLKKRRVILRKVDRCRPTPIAELRQWLREGARHTTEHAHTVFDRPCQDSR